MKAFKLFIEDYLLRLCSLQCANIVGGIAVDIVECIFLGLSALV